MMLAELRIIFSKVSPEHDSAAYQHAILDENVLGKSTRSTRERTWQRLSALYMLERTQDAFRILRSLWDVDTRSQPMLAFLMACWRDPLLRQSSTFLSTLQVGSLLRPQQTMEHLQQEYPHRFGDKTRLSIAQNLASTWTQAGYLEGRSTKRRRRPEVTPVVTAFAFFLADLRGARGTLLFDSPWARLLDHPRNDLVEQVSEASKQGWLRYKSSGSVTEITFPTWNDPVKEAV